MHRNSLNVGRISSYSTTGIWEFGKVVWSKVQVGMTLERSELGCWVFY